MSQDQPFSICQIFTYFSSFPSLSLISSLSSLSFGTWLARQAGSSVSAGRSRSSGNLLIKRILNGNVAIIDLVNTDYLFSFHHGTRRARRARGTDPAVPPKSPRWPRLPRIAFGAAPAVLSVSPIDSRRSHLSGLTPAAGFPLNTGEALRWIQIDQIKKALELKC